ncbi:hypothetical protein BJ166DRAFT_183207 [Pestalotiopsis sp. NC0098]|nr:hypothetical protein BJ166DRAFT_183207 [Pestalotiopsis sp. NC0098]
MQIILVISSSLANRRLTVALFISFNVVILGPSRRVHSGGGYRRRRYPPCDLTVPVPVPVPGSNIFFFSSHCRSPPTRVCDTICREIDLTCPLKEHAVSCSPPIGRPGSTWLLSACSPLPLSDGRRF